jgi:hypothetical protein
MVATATTPVNDRRIGGAPPAPTPERPDDSPPRVLPKWARKMRQDHIAETSALQRRISHLEDELMHTRTAARELREAQFQAQNALAVYGDKTELSEIKQRVALHPTFAELPEQGRALVAQVAKAMGVNPFMHLHCWMQGNKLQITLDYKGLLFLAGADNIMETTRLLTRDELIARGVNEKDIDHGAIGAVCEVTEIDKAARCKAAGIEYKPVLGFSVWYPEQTKKKRDGGTYTITNEPPNGRDGAWVAERNALRAALYKVSDLGLKLARHIEGVHESEEGWAAELPEHTPAPDMVEGTFTETAEPKAAATDVTNADPEPPQADSPPVGSEPKRCKNCKERAAVETGLGDDYCALCADRIANQQAAKES